MDELQAEFVRESNGVLPISLSEEEIMAVENELGHRLPDDYRTFLQHFGCYSIDAYFSFLYGERGLKWKSIGLFLGITPTGSHPFPFDRTFDLLICYKNIYSQYLPPHMMCIADNSGPERLCLSISGENKGSIFWWDRIEEFDGSNCKGIYFIAPSFNEFMRMLRTEEQFELESN